MSRCLVLLLLVGGVFFFHPRIASASDTTVYLHGSGSNNNPATLYLDSTAPTAGTDKYTDSAGVNFTNGNPWEDIGTWSADPSLTHGSVTSVSDLTVWLGLKNSDDQGTQFDLQAQVLKNGTVIATGITRCISGITRNQSLAKQAAVTFPSVVPFVFNGSTDTLSLRLQTRVGTNTDDTRCGGHTNARGLRVYYDSQGRPAAFDITQSQVSLGDKAYIANANDDNVTVVDTTTGALISTIPVGNQPIGIVANPVEHKVYVDNTLAHTVSVIDTDTNSVIDTISLGGASSLELAISPEGSRLYATGWGIGQPITVIDTATDSVVATLLSGLLAPQTVVVSPDNTKLYVANGNCCVGNPVQPGYLSVLDITNNYAPLASVPLQREPYGMEVTPDGTHLYISENGGASQGHTVDVVDTSTYSIVATINVGINPYNGAVNSTGTRVYVPNTYYWAGGPHGTVSVIDTATNTVIATIDVGSTPNQLTISPDDSHVYVANSQSNTVSVIDTATNTVNATWSGVGSNPYELVVP